MPNPQISTSKTIAVIVENREDLSFVYDVDSRTTYNSTNSDPQCTVTISQETFEKLLSGTSTFEKEVHKGSLVISGDSQLLRNIGNLVRLKS